MTIPINIKTLLSEKVVESERIEFKKGWNPVPVMRTIPDFIKEDSNQDNAHVNKEIDNSNEDGNHDSNHDGNHDGNHDKVAIREHIDVAVSNLVIERIIDVLKFCTEPKSREEILNKIGLSNQTKNFNDNVKPAVDSGLLEMTMPNKPKSKNQQYRTTDKAKRML